MNLVNKCKAELPVEVNAETFSDIIDFIIAQGEKGTRGKKVLVQDRNSLNQDKVTVLVKSFLVTKRE